MLFNELEKVLTGADEALVLKIQRTERGVLSVSVIPTLRPESGKDGDDTVLGFRMALAIPQRVIGTADELDAGFFRQLKEYGAARRDASGGMTAAEQVREAAKVAQAKSAGKKAGAAAPSGEAKTDVAEAVETQGNPESLFGGDQ